MDQEQEEQGFKIKGIGKEDKVPIIQRVKPVLKKVLVSPQEEEKLKMNKTILLKELPEVGRKIID